MYSVHVVDELENRIVEQFLFKTIGQAIDKFLAEIQNEINGKLENFEIEETIRDKEYKALTYTYKLIY